MPKKTEEIKESSIFDYLRFGESYTSLILGIVVVIVATILLLSFVHNKNINKNSPDLQAETIAQITLVTSPTVTPSHTIAPSPTEKPEVKKVEKEKAVKAVTPTKVVKKVVAKPTAKSKAKEVVQNKKGVYTVKKGDSLWSISEKTYKSGYNWVDIARVNKLNNPGTIHAGNKLILPKVELKKPVVVKANPTSTVAPKVTKGAIKAVTGGSTSRLAEQKAAMDKKVAQKLPGTKITEKTYKVVRGDNLWNISVRAYGDGYQWVKIAKANKLANPDLIYAGNKLVLPRGK